MTNEDAKFILHAYRPDGSDAGEATFDTALKLAREDPALARWFERQQAFDRAVAAKLRSIEPPPDLRAAILAGGRVSGQPHPTWWRQPVSLAAAAGLLVLLTASVLIWPARASGNGALLAFVANDARHPELHGGTGEAAGALQARLSQPASRLDSAAPVNFDVLRSTGCRSLSFQGHDLLEVCFKRNGAWFHCYIARRADFPSLVVAARPTISELNQVDIATWADAAHVYLVAGDAGRAALQRLL